VPNDSIPDPLRHKQAPIGAVSISLLARDNVTVRAYALIDESEAEWVLRHMWRLLTVGRSSTGYAQAAGMQKGPERGRLHRLLLHPDAQQAVDHVNLDTLDNRRTNLRLCSHAENLRNTIVSRRNNTTGFKGVVYDRRKGKYRACISMDGQKHRLGWYADPQEAALVYDEAARRLHGAFARTNFAATQQKRPLAAQTANGLLVPKELT